MNVAIFASAFHPHVGGVEELCRQLALEYRRRGIDAIVITNRYPRDLPAAETFEGIPVYRVPMRTPTGGLRIKSNYYLTHAAIKRSIIQILRRHNVELLHIQCVSSSALYALHAKRRLALPLVTTLQGELTMDATELYQKCEFSRRLLREVLAESEVITGCSAQTLTDAEAFFGRPFGRRGHVVFNGANVDDFVGATPHRHPRPYVLAIGRLVPQKGFDVLIRAYAQAALSSHDVLLAGVGAEQAALAELIESLGLSGRVHLVGRADRARVVALFAGCDFFVLPSRIEPFGIVNLEAMAAGKPIIASRTGGVPEIVTDGETGLLVPPEDPGALAAAMRTLANDPKLRHCLGAAGQRHAQMFCWSRIAQRYLDLCEPLVMRTGGLVTTPPNRQGQLC